MRPSRTRDYNADRVEGAGGAPEGWAACTTAVREYDQDMIDGCKEEIDSLLVFVSCVPSHISRKVKGGQAGLFSAVLTAFIIESYKFLQRDSDDTTAALLLQISLQLSSFSVNGSSVSSSHRVTPTLPPFQMPRGSVRINTFWFSSLVLSLISALVCILLKQWLREYM
jgi:hypothetical protein